MLVRRYNLVDKFKRDIRASQRDLELLYQKFLIAVAEANIKLIELASLQSDKPSK